MAKPTSDDSSATISIVELPDNLLLHILSLLPSTLNALQTSLVCQKWRNLLHSLASLHFSLALFPYTYTPSETLRCFTDFINRTLILRSCCTPILRFHLKFAVIDTQYISHIQSWIRYAVNNGVVDLDIDLLKPWDFGEFDLGRNSDGFYLRYYEFPFSILRNSCVRVLKLNFCKIWLPANSQFSSLRSVTFDGVVLTEQMFSDFMLSCVNLEDLVLVSISGFSDVRICSSKLRKLSLSNFVTWGGSLEVVAPNLVSIMIFAFFVEEYVFKEMISLVEVSILMDLDHWTKLVRLLGNVKHLTTYNCWFQLLATEVVPSEGLVLNNLNLLEMHTRYTKTYILGIAAMCECSHNLETLILNGIEDLKKQESLSEEDMNAINFDMPRLKQVRINDFRGTNNELLFVRHLVEQGAVLEMILLVPANGGKVSLDGLEKLKLSKDILHVRKLNGSELR